MGKSILGILAVIVLQIAFIIYITLDTPVDVTVSAVDTNAGAANYDLSILNDLNQATVSGDSAAVTIDSQPAPSSKKVKAVTVVNLRKIRHTPSQNQRLSARAVSYQPRESDALRPEFGSYVRREFFGNWVVEITYGISNERAKHISRTKKRPYTA